VTYSGVSRSESQRRKRPRVTWRVTFVAFVETSRFLVLALLIVICALFGLAVGSFLNVVIYRVPHHESIVSPRSKCPSCQSPIRERDNIPVLSWLILRGRCRDCRAPISARYLVVELLGGALFAGLAGRLGYNWDLPAFLALLSGLLALSFIDMEHLTLPKKVVYPTLVLEAIFLVIAAAAYDSWHRLLIAALCGASWFAAFFLINLASPRALGFGDVRLAALLGLGWGGSGGALSSWGSSPGISSGPSSASS
jgi:leader peptidase (prepilin peptidase)/N-methyltransferase